jgi:hypothetical protein
MSNPSNRITGVTVGGTAATLDVSAVSVDGQNIVEIWRASSVAGGTRNIVVNLTATSGQYITLGAEERDDIPASPLMTTGTGGPTTSSAPAATTSGSTTETPAVLYAAFVDYAGTNWTSATPPTSWTESWEEPNGGTRQAGSGAYFSDFGGTGTKTATFATGASMSWVCAIAAYKQTGGGGGSAAPRAIHRFRQLRA